MPAPLSSRRRAPLDALKARRGGLRQPTEKPAPPAPAPGAAPRLSGPVYRPPVTRTLSCSAPPLRAFNPEGQVRVSHTPTSATCRRAPKSSGQSASAYRVRAPRQVRSAEPAAPPRAAPPLKSSGGRGRGGDPRSHSSSGRCQSSSRHWFMVLSTCCVPGAAGHGPSK